MSEHNEPWYVFSHYGDPEIRTREGDKLVAVLLPSKLQDARRIVACVNACEGIGTEYLERFSATTFNDFKRMKDQRDELLAALLPIAERGEISAKIITDAKAAIAKARGACNHDIKGAEK